MAKKEEVKEDKKAGKEKTVTKAVAGKAPSVTPGKMQVVGIDVANSTIKIWGDDEKSIVYRNTVKEIDDAGLVYSFKTSYHMYVYNNEVYEVGDLSATGSGSRGKTRYGSKAFKIETLIGITTLLESGQGHKVFVVTGVPSYLAKNKTIIEDIKTALKGTHSLKSVFWDKVDDVEFEIVDVLVVPQPLGTMYNYIYDPKSNTLNEKFIEQRALVIDIGWGTSDIAILESGRVRSTFGFDIGTSDYISAIQEEVNHDMPQANIQSLNPHELDALLLKSYTVETPFGTFDLSAYPETNKEKQAERIYQEVMSLGLEFNKFYRIILSGGGALLYEKYLREKFNDPRLIVQPDAVTANARGFYLLGKAKDL